MAVATHKSIASLMQKTLQRQAAAARASFKLKQNQVQQILINYASEKDAGLYSNLVKAIKEIPLNDDNYNFLLEDCLSSVVILGRNMKQFVEVVCNIDWTNRNESLIEVYSKFIINLVTAHTYHCPKVMIGLIKKFKEEGENWVDSPSVDVLRRWSYVHSIIAEIVAIMPMTSDLLMQTVIEQYPYYKSGCYQNRAYVHNLIWMTKYIPSLREQIMTAIVNRMVIMDVNIVDRQKAKEQVDTAIEMEVDEENEVAETLDHCMLEVLHWLQDERDPALNVMCNIFERIVLPTYGIRHVQFLLLYTVSINQQCADRVLNNLWIVAAGLHSLGPGALATRRTAASHLAGLLARCVRVPNSRLVNYLKNMADWCHSYVSATQESTTASDNTKVHGAFLAVCHAVFYLVAFKNHQLFATKESINFVESLNLPRLVTSTLNPLRSCAPQVARAFSSVTRAHQLVYCQAILEKNARHSLHATANHYDAWFPYDPYTLPRSGKIIWPLCIEYKDWLKEGDDETQYAGMKRKLEVDDDDYLMSATPSQRFASSLSNSVLPGFKTSESVIV